MPQQKARNTAPKSARRGVTLVEIAIVLVIIGLLLGGVLKGQELINNAKIRNIANRQQSLKIAWFSFIAKYQAMPGDYVAAEQNIPGAPAANGQYIPGDGIISLVESPIAFQNLTGAGFLRCPQCNAQTANANISAATLPQNSYGGLIAIFNNGINAVFNGIPVGGGTSYAFRGGGAGMPRLMSHSGALIPSNIAAEVDRKIDDGIANTGDVVFNAFSGFNHHSPNVTCTSESATTQKTPMELSSPDQLWWRHASAPVDQNCGFSVHF